MAGAHEKEVAARGLTAKVSMEANGDACET